MIISFFLFYMNYSAFVLSGIAEFMKILSEFRKKVWIFDNKLAFFCLRVKNFFTIL